MAGSCGLNTRDWMVVLAFETFAYSALIYLQEWTFLQVFFVGHLVVFLAAFGLWARDSERAAQGLSWKTRSVIAIAVLLTLAPFLFLEVPLSDFVAEGNDLATLWGPAGELSLLLGVMVALATIMAAINFRRENAPR